MKQIKRKNFSRVKESLAKVLFLASACVSILAVVLICVFLFANGIPAIGEVGLFKFLTGKEWRPGNDIYGILPMIVGSLYITAGALLLGVPIGILTALYLSRFASGPVAKLLNPAIELLAGIPSVVYGFFGLVVIVPVLGSSILTASILLGIMILPTIITVSKSALDAVPDSYYEGALALGATHERSVFQNPVPGSPIGRDGSDCARHRPGDRRDDGGHDGGRQPAAHYRQPLKRHSHAYDQYRAGNGLCCRFASGSAHCHGTGAVCLYSDYQSQLLAHSKGGRRKYDAKDFLCAAVNKTVRSECRVYSASVRQCSCSLVRAAAAITAVVLLFLVGYILVKGIPHLSLDLFAWKYNCHQRLH